MTRDLKVLGLASLIWGFGDGMIIYLTPLYLSELGADPSQIGGILGIGALLMALSQIPAGILSDRFGRKPLLLTSGLIGLIATVIMSLAASLTVFVVGFWLWFISGFMFSPMASYISATKSPWAFTRSLATISALYGMGSIFGPVTGGQIAQVFELRTIYLVAILSTSISAITLVFLPPQPIVKSTKREGLGTVRSNLPLIKFLAIAFFILLAMSLSWPLTPVYLQEIKLVSVATIGILGSLNALGVVILNLVVGRFKSRQGFLISLVLVGFSVIFIWKGMGILWYGLGYFFAAGFRLFRVLATGHIESFVSIDTAGLGYGIAETVWILTFVVVSPIAGFLYEVEPELPFPVSLVMILISILLIPRLIPPTPQDITTTTQVETFTRKETT